MASALPIDARSSDEISYDRAVAFLKGRPGIDVKHSGASLLDHLIGVHDKLKLWKCRSAVCLAGMFHSIYGTESFRTQTIPIAERPIVEAVIGAEAEQLAYAFCLLKARDLVAQVERHLAAVTTDVGGDTEFEQGVKNDLLHVFVANWLEQMPRLKPLRRVQHTELMRRVRPLLHPSAREEINRTYQFDRTPAQRPVGVGTADKFRADEAAGIVVHDDLVPAHLQQSLSALMELNIWRYGWKAANTQTSHHFWHSHFAGDNGDREASCEAELHGRKLMAPVLALWEFIRDTVAPNHIPVRVYANGHTFGGDGHLHTDSRRAGHYTSIFYAHPAWDINWGGETLFFDETGKDVIRAVHPRPGRLVHFPGTIPHAARSPSRDCPALRSVVVVKTFCPVA